MRLVSQLAPQCPLCHAELQGENRAPFDCPECGETLYEARSSGFKWLRAIVCYAVAALYSWHKGWEPSFIVFIVSFYAIPALVIWRTVEQLFFPATRYEAGRSSVQTLDLS